MFKLNTKNTSYLHAYLVYTYITIVDGIRHLQELDDAMFRRSWICSWSSAFVEYWPLGYNAVDVILNRVG